MLHRPSQLVRKFSRYFDSYLLKGSPGLWCINCRHQRPISQLDPELRWDTVVQCSQCGAYDTLLPATAEPSAHLKSQAEDATQTSSTFMSSYRSSGTKEWSIPGSLLLGVILLVVSAVLGYSATYSRPAANLPEWVCPLVQTLAAILALFGLRSISSMYQLKLTQSVVELERKWLGITERKQLPRSSIQHVKLEVAYLREGQPIYCIAVIGSTGKLKFGTGLTDSAKLSLLEQLKDELQPAVAPSLRGTREFSGQRLSVRADLSRCIIQTQSKKPLKTLPTLLILLSICGFFIYQGTAGSSLGLGTLFYILIPVIFVSIIAVSLFETQRQLLTQQTLTLDATGLHLSETYGSSHKELLAPLADIQRIKVEQFPTPRRSDSTQEPTRRLCVVLPERAISMGLAAPVEELQAATTALQETFEALMNSSSA